MKGSELIIPSAQHLATDSVLMIFQCDLAPVGFVHALCLFVPDTLNVGTMQECPGTWNCLYGWE